MKNASLVLRALVLLLAIALLPAIHAEETEPASEDARVQLHLRLKEDQALLEKLQTQLESREAESTRLADEIDAQVARVKRLKEEIGRRAEGGQPTSEQEKKLAEAEARYKRLRLTAETGLQEIASLKERIASLRKQIAAAEAILAPVDETKEEEKATPPPAETPAPAPTSPAGLPELPLASSPETTPTAAPAGEATATLRPEQIEAAKMAERRAREARKAEQDVVNYVERLTALKTQIQVTEDQIDSQKKTLRELSSLAAELENRLATEGRTEALQRELLRTRKTIAEVEEKRAASEKVLSDLREQERALEAEEAQFVAAAETRRKEAEKARRESQWLQSPLHPRNVAGWVEQRGPRLLIAILAIVVMLFLSRLLVSTLVRISTRRLRGGSIGRVKRIETLGAGYDAVARFVILTGGIFLLMEEAGIDLKALLGGAAIIGVAVAFGAQNLIRDYFNGFM
ncbi:MAG TPA: mechanosensitive ion channel, partial [Thiotrichales bacterium]|nr:mechanosensitive ion channel [Thiotrichales bacterium]